MRLTAWIVTLIGVGCGMSAFVAWADQSEYDRYTVAARNEHAYVIRKHCRPLQEPERQACVRQANTTLAETLAAIKAKYGKGA